MQSGFLTSSFDLLDKGWPSESSFAENVETIRSHYSPSVVPEPIVKRLFVVVENLIDPKVRVVF
jgi:hypothetical protein